jgi:NADP-dependent aldehyde dehydrogenase
MLMGKSLIAGEWVGSDATFESAVVSGAPDTFYKGTPEMVDRAAQAAEEAFWSYGYSKASERVAFLRILGEEIEARGAEITEMGVKETGLPAARLDGERGRTITQINTYADVIEDGGYLEPVVDEALPDRAPLPRPELRSIQRPIGPVGVFGASNFPLAFSTAGGDTASALAAGCPVVVKGHPAHPGVADLVAQAFDAAIKRAGVHPGVFSQVVDGGFAVGQALVKHPLIKAVGFTGSIKAGRALYDMCAGRPEPIPFFGELGSTNPMFILPHALSARGEQIGADWVGSLTMGVGQFCTNPGIAVVVDGADVAPFVEAATAAASEIGAQPMLTDGIAAAYRAGVATASGTDGVETVVATPPEGRNATPHLHVTSADVWMGNEALKDEVFGPFGIVVKAKDMEQARDVAKSLHGQLTCTLHMDDADTGDAQSLMPILERKAGRILANGYPTGVEIATAMVHGGPYPASTNFGATAGGQRAIRRFVRPVCYQNMPTALLPDELKG